LADFVAEVGDDRRVVAGATMQTQMNTFTEQAKSLGEAYNKAATDATKPFRMSI
jgi:hypothetical protein